MDFSFNKKNKETRTSLNTKYVYNFRYLQGEMYNGYHQIENK